MKKFIACALTVIPACVLLPSCKKKIDYFDYVSEYRKNVYLLSEDGFELKIYCTERETPYALDGIKGNTSVVTEVYYRADDTPEKVEFYMDGLGGEMNYMATTHSFYLCYTAKTEKTKVTATLTVDGVSGEFTANSVSEEGAIGGKAALDCVLQYDKGTFEALCEGAYFCGEIQLRLLYDDGCYYYVGVCDREKNVHAYLVDGISGRILAQRQSEAN